MSGFDPSARFGSGGYPGHGGRLGITFHAHGDGWVELALPYRDDLVGAPSSGVIASGPIFALVDMATSLAVWQRVGRFVPHATLDLRLDYLRPATPGQTVIGRGECYRVARSIAFVRGFAHDGDADDPLAHVAGTYMAPEGYQ